MIKMLKSNRDMAFNEIKLTVMIEDPRARERRETLGIEVPPPPPGPSQQVMPRNQLHPCGRRRQVCFFWLVDAHLVRNGLR